MSSRRSASLTRVQVVAEPDPGALPRILERFQVVNICPVAVRSELSVSGFLRIRIDFEDASPETLDLIVRKLAQLPVVVDARCKTMHSARAGNSRSEVRRTTKTRPRPLRGPPNDRQKQKL